MTRIKRIVAVLTLLLGVTMAQNVPQCFSEASNTGKITCTRVDLRGTTGSVFNSISGLRRNVIRSVELSECTIDNLEFLNSDYLQQVTILTLSKVQGLSADSFTTTAFSYLKDSLVELSISAIQSLGSVDGLKDSFWRSLKKLEVRDCSGITTIHKDVFERTPEVNSYDFRYNNLRSLDMSTHRAVSNVKTVVARHNQLGSVAGLEAFYRLQTLDLAENRLTKADFLDELLENGLLTDVDLSSNRLNSFTLKAQGTGSRQISINLENNDIQSISELGSSSAKNVQNLNLGRNKALQLTEQTLQGLNELKVLRLHNTGITQVITHLTNLPKLQNLDLQQNEISDMPSEAFRGTTGLQTLQLQDNRLSKLPFLSSSTIILPELTYLDISRNQLDYLENFVATPKLVHLRMNGSPTSNRFTQLSACSSLNQIPSTLAVVCAMDIQAASSDCKFRTFINLVKDQVLYNNKPCCENPDNNCCKNPKACDSSLPQSIGCPADAEVCAINPVNPSVSTPSPNPGEKRETCIEKQRAEFENLYASEQAVMAIGYVLALLFFLLATILCIRRPRVYDKWLKDHRDTEASMRSESHQPVQMQMSNSSFDDVDGTLRTRGASASPKLSTLPRGSPKQISKSLDNMSIASGASHYSTIGKNAFSGRDKFKDANSIEMNERYIAPVSPHPMKKSQSQESEDSPTTMSVYSYASHQPERSPVDMSPNRRRHRSGGALPSHSNPRSRSEDLLDTRSIDSDLVPPKIMLQRKATVRNEDVPIVRNTRSHSTAPYRVRKGGRKKSISPLLSSKQYNRNPGAPTPPMTRRALPATPLEKIPLPHATRSGSSLASSGGSDPRNNSVFAMDENDDFITTETQIGFG